MKIAFAEDYEILMPTEDQIIPAELSQSPADLDIASASREIREVLNSFAAEEETCFTYTRG